MTSVQRILTVAILLVLGVGTAHAQTNQIQVYGDDINKPGELSITLHNNYTITGRTQPAFPGGIVPNHSLNGSPELSYGLTEWWEIGAFLPVYSYTGGNQLLFDGFKVRSLFLVPHAEERPFYYGANFEFSYNQPQWDPDRFTGEIRPILGLHFGKVGVIVNPIVGYSFSAPGAAEFTPAARVDYRLAEEWAIAAEYYADFGKIRNIDSGNAQGQSLFAVLDYYSEPGNVEFGIGHGFTDASDKLVVKLILGRHF